jgi:WD40 repeat protein
LRIRCADATTLALVGELTSAHDNNRVNSVVFSPDGSRIVSGGDDGRIKMWGER